MYLRFTYPNSSVEGSSACSKREFAGLFFGSDILGPCAAVSIEKDPIDVAVEIGGVGEIAHVENHIRVDKRACRTHAHWTGHLDIRLMRCIKQGGFEHRCYHFGTSGQGVSSIKYQVMS